MMKALEFYSGIGGLHYSLSEARGDSAEVLAAFDVNPLANKVYERNHGIRPNASDIGSLKPAYLDAYEADVWLLSPPCQPYTRQGLQLGSQDPRAESFILLLEKIEKLENPPNYLLIENVVGFEKSSTREYLIATMKRNNYTTQEFVVSPLDLGVPYSRSRYFCIAKRQPLRFSNPQGDFQFVPKPPQWNWKEEEGEGEEEEEERKLMIKDFLVDTSDDDDRFFVKKAVKDKYLDCIDIVTPFSSRCCCFTKSYFKFFKGTGSVIAVNAIPLAKEKQKGEKEHHHHHHHKEEEEEGKREGEGDGSFVDADGLVHIHLSSIPGRGNVEKVQEGILEKLNLRYFTPREVANLHSFPPHFTFPEDVTIKQRYALLGNSLSVAVVKRLLLYLFSEE